MMLLIRFVLITVAFVLTIGSNATVAQVDQPRGPVPGRFIVKLAERADVQQLSQALSKDTRLSPATMMPGAELP
ncbi:hypothetical protein GF356_08910, partial [candidate division GN15 bacterium]|nr:hypothetical protein [candidate division GN15 bacterium]